MATLCFVRVRCSAIAMVDIFFPYNIVGNQCCDTVRIEPEYLDNCGNAFWKLKSYNGEYASLLQGNSQNKLAKLLSMIPL